MSRRGALCLIVALLPGAGASAGGLQRHFYSTADADSLAALRRHAREMDLVSPQWFEVDASGRLVDRVDAEVAAWAREAKLRLMPLVLNQGFRPEIASLVLNDARVQADLVRDLVEAGGRWRIRGFQLDFENVPAEDRVAFTAFARSLARRLRERKLRLSIAVPAPLWTLPGPLRPDPVNERSRAFDYRALAAVSEFLTVMTYDEHTAPDAPGPVAGRPWVGACLARLLSEVPAKRIMLGVPLYYRRWKGGAVLEGPHAEAVALAEARGVAVARDPVEREGTFAFEDAGERNVVWVQDAETLRERLEDARRLGLAGFSAWRLGQEDPAAWPVLSGRK